MAQQESQAGGKAQWNDDEVDFVLDYLIDNQAKGGDGGNFKKETTNNAAAALNSSGVSMARGPLKTGSMVKTKWSTVCYLDYDRSYIHGRSLVEKNLHCY